MKTAEELGLTKGQYDAMVTLREGLCKGEFIHKPYKYDIVLEKEEKDKKVFNMRVWRDQNQNNCGSVCCIGGWIESLSSEEIISGKTRYDNNKELFNLFHPLFDKFGINNEGRTEFWNKITPHQAAAAINNFLNEGEAHWEDILEGVGR